MFASYVLQIHHPKAYISNGRPTFVPKSFFCNPCRALRHGAAAVEGYAALKEEVRRLFAPRARCRPHLLRHQALPAPPHSPTPLLLQLASLRRGAAQRRVSLQVH
ncbi:hypothetical protein EJB05_10462, partial [Eragrostis curvula]